jgi:hypothetical protein
MMSYDDLVDAYRDLDAAYTQLLDELTKLRREVAETRREFHRLQSLDRAQKAERDEGASLQ